MTECWWMLIAGLIVGASLGISFIGVITVEHSNRLRERIGILELELKYKEKGVNK